MKISKLFCVTCLALIPASALASQELDKLIRCHEALEDKSDGQSTKLSIEEATPILIPSGKKLYFVTSDSVAVLDNTFAGKDIVFQLSEKKSPFYRKVAFQKNGDIGTVTFATPSAEEIKKAVSPSAQLSESSLNVFKKELTKRMDSVTAQYQNKYNPEGTIKDLSVCSAIKSPELQKSLEKQLSFYEKLARKKTTGKGGKSAKPYGTQ